MTGFEDASLDLLGGTVALRRREGAPGAGSVVFAHANGLNAGAYAPMLAALGGPETVVALDLRGHGRTRIPAEPDTLTRWDLYADDVRTVLAALAPPPPLTLAGHSMGAVAMLLAASGAGADRLLMIEPVVVPRIGRLIARSPLRRPVLAGRGIAARAARRRDGWPDAATVRTQYAGTAFFAGWHEAALDGYLADGLRSDGDGVRLACAPAWEAASFAAQGHRLWGPLLAAVERMPVHVLRGRGGSTVPVGAAAAMARAGVRLTEAGGGHMLPAERPADAAVWLRLALSDGGV